MDGQTDTTTAYNALAQRRAVKTTSCIITCSTLHWTISAADGINSHRLGLPGMVINGHSLELSQQTFSDAWSLSQLSRLTQLLT